MDKDSPTAVKSAARVLDLFELLARRRSEMSHAEMADALGIPKSSLTHLLGTLVARGYLAQSPDKRGYRLGGSLLDLVVQQTRLRDLPTLAAPVLSALTRACGESSALNLPMIDETVVAAAEMAPHRLVSHMREGDRAPLYATSGGKAVLAFMSAEECKSYLIRVRFERFTARTLTSVTALTRELAQVRRDGLAYSREEFTPGVVGMAVPVMAADGRVIASVNVAMPAVRFDAAAAMLVAEALRAAAQALRRAMDPGA